MSQAAVNIRWITKDPKTIPQKMKRNSDCQFVELQKYRGYVKDWKVLENLHEDELEELIKINETFFDKVTEIEDELRCHGF